MYKEYQSNRLILKTLSIIDVKTVLDYYDKNRYFLEHWGHVHSDVFYSQDYQENILANTQIDMLNGKALQLWAFKNDKPYDTIGYVHFSNIIRGSYLSCCLHLQFAEKELGNGYASEAVSKGIKIIFDEYDLHRIEANVMISNKPAIHLTENLGFCSEGISKKLFKINGIWQDHVRMVLLNPKLE